MKVTEVGQVLLLLLLICPPGSAQEADSTGFSSAREVGGVHLLRADRGPGRTEPS